MLFKGIITLSQISAYQPLKLNSGTVLKAAWGNETSFRCGFCSFWIQKQLQLSQCIHSTIINSCPYWALARYKMQKKCINYVTLGIRKKWENLKSL